MNAVRQLVDRIQGKAPKGAKRSKLWSAHRKAYMAGHVFCAVCGSRKGLEAHHIVPFHLAPDLELDPENLIALCRRCHLFVGHLGAWARFNLTAQSDAAYWRMKICS